VKFSPDARLVLSGANDAKLLLWNVQAAKAIRSFDGHAGAVNCLAFSPDGKQAASGGADKTLRLWDVETGKQVRSFDGHTKAIVSVAFSPDGRSLASGAEDRTARFWTIASGKEERVYKGHSSPVYAVAWLSEGQEVATVSCGLRVAGGVLQGTQVLMQRLKWGEPKAQIDALDTEMLDCAAFSPNDRYVLLGMSWKQGGVLLWDLRTRKLARDFDIVQAGQNPDGGHGTNWIAAVAFSPDGAMALAGGRGKRDIYVWDLQTGRRLARFLGHAGEVLSLAVSPDSRHAVSGSKDKTIRFWRLPTP